MAHPPPPPPPPASSPSKHCSIRSILSSIAIFLSGVSFALTISAAFNVSNYYRPSTISSTPGMAGVHHGNDYDAPVPASCHCNDDGPGSNIFIEQQSRGRGEATAVEVPVYYDNITNNDGQTIRDLQSSLQAERQETKALREIIMQLQEGQEIASTNTTNISRSMATILRDRLLQSSKSGGSRPSQAFLNNDNNNDDDGDDDDDDGICSLLPHPTPSILSLWSSHLPQIFNATRHSADPTYIFHDFTAQLLHILTPDRLQRSIKTLPLDWTPVRRGLDILHRRLSSIYDEVQSYHGQYELGPDDDIPLEEMKRINDNPNHPRKLNILVMGGSVTMGVVCHINPVTTSTGKYSRRDCAWPGRLSHFFTKLFGGFELVNVHTVSLGGTNTESGITIWDYSLLPSDVPYPDVVLNAYATNDMHYNTVQEAIRRNITLGESLLTMGQEFVRLLLTPKSECAPRAPPLLLYVDDYLGNEQNEILTTMISPQTINLLSGYYGIGSMSYGDAVRDIVYGDTKEWWLSSDWYEKGKSQYQRAVHPHMGMHIGMVWVVAYNLFNLVTSYCSLPKITAGVRSGRQRRQPQHDRHHAGVESSSEGVWDYGYSNSTFGGNLPALQGTNELVGGPKHKPRGLPPLLTPELSLEHITELWRNESNSNSHLWKTNDECSDIDTSTSNYDDDDRSPHDFSKPCIYSWVANLERKLDNTQRITDRLKPHITSNKGWSAVDDNNKLGWAPTAGIGSSFTMEWKSISQPVRAVTWMIMRSYGEKWDGSLLNIEVWSGNILMAKQNIEGFHDKKTSETYNIKMKLFDNDEKRRDEVGNGAVIGSDLKIIFTLIGGSTFKISGMAVCDH